MAQMNPVPLIEASELSDRLASSDCITVDCRFSLADADAGSRSYRRAHIPGARYAHLDKDLARKPGAQDGRHPLPRAEDFARTLGSWGISESSYVVAYDDSSGAIAARLWWMLRWVGHEQVAVLDGGMAGWQAAGLSLHTESPLWKPAQFHPATTHDEWIVAGAAIDDCLQRGNLVVDARAAARFQGEQEPIDPIAGHIPGAVNCPFTQCVDHEGRFLRPGELRTLFELAFGRHDAGQVIAMCGSGVTACHLLLAMKVAGLDDGRLYVGSWSEWIRDPTRPIATGP